MAENCMKSMKNKSIRALLNIKFKLQTWNDTMSNTMKVFQLTYFHPIINIYLIYLILIIFMLFTSLSAGFHTLKQTMTVYIFMTEQKTN